MLVCQRPQGAWSWTRAPRGARRSLCVAAAKGDPRAQRLFFYALALSEDEAQRAAEQVLEPILTIRQIIVDPKDP